jgi:hypothetical protein
MPVIQLHSSATEASDFRETLTRTYVPFCTLLFSAACMEGRGALGFALVASWRVTLSHPVTLSGKFSSGWPAATKFNLVLFPGLLDNPFVYFIFPFSVSTAAYDALPSYSPILLHLE